MTEGPISPIETLISLSRFTFANILCVFGILYTMKIPIKALPTCKTCIHKSHAVRVWVTLEQNIINTQQNKKISMPDVHHIPLENS